MVANWHYPLPSLIPGVLQRRYKRFFADVLLEDGSEVTAHCPNTGPMTGIYVPGRPVYLSRSDDPKRKLPYTWEMIDLDGTWVGTNTNFPNRVMKQLLIDQGLPSLAGCYTAVRSEVPYGRDRQSRIDFLLEGGDRPIYVEVKNTTWCQGSLALFPDTVTTRGQKHLRELMELPPEALGVMVYFINRGDCDRFAPGTSADPTYGDLFATAIKRGVRILPCRFALSPQGFTFLGLAPCDSP